jgi:hypothetical protein
VNFHATGAIEWRRGAVVRSFCRHPTFGAAEDGRASPSRRFSAEKPVENIVRRHLLSQPASIVLLFAVIAILSAARVLLSERNGTPPPEPPGSQERARTVPDAVAAQYVGDQACAGCHPSQFHDHAATNHARTLRPMDRKQLPKQFPRVARYQDPDTGIRYEMGEAYGQFRLATLSPFGVQSREIDLAIGSGKRAMTFVSREGEHGLIELRLSYFPARGTGFITPGQKGPGMDPIGHLHEGKLAQRCLGCHSTIVPESRVVPDVKFMGVGCEACHGPGQRHISAATTGSAAGTMARLGTWGGKRLNELCGDCHRTERDVDPSNPVAVDQTQRMQPYGLMKSACFQKSGDRLSCLTCHDPHRNSQKSHVSYERACRSCHGQTTGSTVCPVNRRDNCVSCHMPPKELLPGINMADHWIRVHPDASGQKAAMSATSTSGS